MQSFSFDTIKVLVTSYCNLNCKHCYQHFDKNRYQLSREQLFEIIDFACENRTKNLDFSGGEFFTHPNAYEILEYCLSKKIKVNISTNGIDIQMPFFKKYINKKLITIQMSIDGMRHTHEKRRGKGTFDKTMLNAQKLHELGIPLTVSMAMDEHNYLDAIDVLELPYFSRTMFLPVAFVGAAQINMSALNQEKYEETICELMRNAQNEEQTFQSQVFPNTLAIKYDGGVYISATASDYDLLCFGNINKKKLKSIVDDYYGSETYKRIITIDNKDIFECNVCKESDNCDRGCRLRALKFFGDMLKPDPFCCRIMNINYQNIPIGKLFWGEK